MLSFVVIAVSFRYLRMEATLFESDLRLESPLPVKEGRDTANIMEIIKMTTISSKRVNPELAASKG